MTQIEFFADSVSFTLNKVIFVVVVVVVFKLLQHEKYISKFEANQSRA